MAEEAPSNGAEQVPYGPILESPLVGETGGSHQFWKYERHNCSVCTFLTVVEVLLSANGITWDPSCILGTVFADRSAMKDGLVSTALRNCQTLCLSVYGHNVDQSNKLDGCWFLPMIFHADMPHWLGRKAGAIAPFSCVRVKRGKVPIRPLLAGSSDSGPPLVRNEVTVLHVLSDQCDTVVSVFRNFLPLVVGPLPLFVHVEFRQVVSLGVTEAPQAIRCDVLRLDEQYATAEKTVEYVFAGAACKGGFHFNAIVVTADGVAWDYDCMQDEGRLVVRSEADTVKTRTGYHFSYAVYRRSSEVDVSPVNVGSSACAVACSTPKPGRMFAPCVSAGNEKPAPGLSKQDSLRNLAFLRDVTGDCGYKRKSASSYDGELESLKNDAFDLAARVLYYQTMTGHPVHGPGRAKMVYHKYAGKGTGGASVAPVSPVAKEIRYSKIHDRMLEFAMRGTLQEFIKLGLAEVVTSGYLIENVKCKGTRCKGPINYEKRTRWTLVDGEKSYRRDRSELGWVMELQKASSGHPTYTWPVEGMVDHESHPEGLCHVDTHGRLDEGLVVVMLLLTPHGGNSPFLVVVSSLHV